ncbi:MAG TPA: D-alanine--D-alanine ligase, partial [Gammaproteobacteria bacterium]|nr:D-alanine--D-alanine ligase [Gammaproteobacteria bacterium]
MRPKIALVYDAQAEIGRPDSSDTLVEARAISAALETLGYDTTRVPVSLDLTALERTLRALAPQAVVNLVESLEGRGELVQVVPALLESLGLPFTGCSAWALGATQDKMAVKSLLAAADIATPATFGAAARSETNHGPWIVKAACEHSSLGIDDSSVVGSELVPQVLAKRRAEFGGRWFAERFVAGRELNAAVIAAPNGPRVLPIAEIRFDGFPADKPAIVGYAAKWDADSFEYRNTNRSFAVEAELAARAERLALACWQLFALDGYARVDFRVDGSGLLYVLEVNANPCLSPDAGFA